MGNTSNYTSQCVGNFEGATAKRILVCSVPKSGTYLLSAILSELGVQDTRLHISREVSSLLVGGTRDDYRTNPDDYKFAIPAQGAIQSIPPGHFALSHLGCDRNTRNACRGLSILFLYRDLRDCSVSFMRFIADTGRDNSAQASWIRAEDGPARMAAFLDAYRWYYDDWVAPMLDWQWQRQALPVRFESLLGDFGATDQHQTLTAICRHIGVDSSTINFEAVFSAALSTSTITWSGNRTRRDRYWSPEVESRFQAYGGLDLNRRLGYEDETQVARKMRIFSRRMLSFASIS